MLRLEERVEELGRESNTSVHPDFRLWLTSMPSKVGKLLCVGPLHAHNCKTEHCSFFK